MVGQMVEMERSYLTAEVFREILASTHAVDELSQEVHVSSAAASVDPLPQCAGKTIALGYSSSLASKWLLDSCAHVVAQIPLLVYALLR